MRSSPSGRCVISSTVVSRRRRARRPSARSRSVSGRGARSARRGAARARRRAARARARGAGAGRPRAAPSSPTSVSRPSGSEATQSARRARPSAGAQLVVASAPGRASRRFSRIVESKRCASWPASANVRRTSSWRYSRRSRPSSVTRPCSGSRKRSSRFVDGRLAGAARADERDAPARLEREARRRRAPARSPGA